MSATQDAVASAAADAGSNEVSVVICSRNGLSRGFLDEALRSVQMQTLPAHEILLIDDASNDGTADYVRASYPQVTVLHNAGVGLAGARNTGIRSARAPWIAFLDDDDIWCPGKLEEQLAQANASASPEAAIWASRFAIIRTYGGTPMACATPLHFAQWPGCLLGCPVYPSGVLLHRNLLARMGPLNEQIKEGSAYDYWIRCLRAGIPIHYSVDTLLHYRHHHPQMTVTSPKPGPSKHLDALIAPYLEQLPPALANRMQAARVLNTLRSLLAHAGIRAAVQYGIAIWPPPRAMVFFVLETLACRAPVRMRPSLRQWAFQVLMGKDTSLPVACGKMSDYST